MSCSANPATQPFTRPNLAQIKEKLATKLADNVAIDAFLGTIFTSHDRSLNKLVSSSLKTAYIGPVIFFK